MPEIKQDLRTATMIVAANNSLHRNDANYVCDGVGDEVEINQALNALPAGGGRVILSEGTFTLAHPITIPASYITLEGNGWATFIDGDGLPTTEHGIVLSGFSYVHIKNLRIQTQDGGGKTCHCIFIEDGANEFVIDRVCIFESDSDGIHIEGTSINKGWIQDCYVEGVDDNGIFVDMDAGDIIQNLIIKKNIIHSCGVDGIHFWNTGGPYETCIIEGNDIAACVGCGIYIWDSVYFTISGNVIDTVTAYGIRLRVVLYSNIENNVIYRSSSSGIMLEAAPNNTIAGNFIIDTQDAVADGIEFDSVETKVLGNYLHGCGRYGIAATGARSSIVGNTIEESGDDGVYVRATEIQVKSNYIYDNGQDAAETYHGIKLDENADKCQISDNFINSPGDSQEDGIHLEDGAQYVQIVGNYCFNGMGSGIALMANNDYCLIKVNYCLENDDYGIEIAAATCNENTVENNKLVGNVTGQILDSGTDTILPEVVIDAPNPDANIGEFPAQQMLDGVDTEVRMKLHCPSDFQELVRARVILVPGGTGDLRRSVNTDFGKICADEAHNAHSDSIAAGEVAVTANELECIDIDAALTGIEASDWIGVRFTRVGSHGNDDVGATVWLIGIRMQYV